MSREVDPKGCHLLEKSSQLVSQSTEPIKRSVEIHAGSEELLPFPGDRGLTSGKTTEREEEENAEVVNGDHQSKEGSGSDENCVGSVSAQAGSEGNCESFPDDSSEDPVEGSENSIKPKIPLSDPVVVPNFFLPPQEMETSMRLLSTSSHPSASPEGPLPERSSPWGAQPPGRTLSGAPQDAHPGVPAGPGVPTPALSRHRRGHTDPGCLHHRGCGRGLRAAHRRGQGAVPGQRGPVEQRAPLQQHCGRYRTIAREEGIRGLWRGTPPNIARNAVINCGELVTYDLIKDALLRAQLMADNVPCHFVAAFGAGFCATVVASPVDVVKTRYMNASPGQYSNALSCLLALLTQDGPAGLYKGSGSEMFQLMAAPVPSRSLSWAFLHLCQWTLLQLGKSACASWLQLCMQFSSHPRASEAHPTLGLSPSLPVDSSAAWKVSMCVVAPALQPFSSHPRALKPTPRWAFLHLCQWTLLHLGKSACASWLQLCCSSALILEP
ncbi:uncharacterized protein LOC117011439 isoform X4 [Catharus ustulatus]|uniref:uncharacterized protein LOC117011439 isoform X4 n=1 Tax=Catharus ustulatus TaxID=91951 RepID=UPI00140A5113|nr:uncharacterized protein LOC117011439 isoform X4 [Catharus ustulatus]